MRQLKSGSSFFAVRRERWTNKTDISQEDLTWVHDRVDVWDEGAGWNKYCFKVDICLLSPSLYNLGQSAHVQALSLGDLRSPVLWLHLPFRPLVPFILLLVAELLPQGFLKASWPCGKNIVDSVSFPFFYSLRVSVLVSSKVKWRWINIPALPDCFENWLQISCSGS